MEPDFKEPKNRFVWAFQGLEVNGQPVAFPRPVLEQWSEHLSRCGFIHVDEVAGCPSGENPLKYLPSQEIHYQPPVRGQATSFNLAGEWVPIDQPIRTAQDPGLSKEEKQALINQFKEEGLID